MTAITALFARSATESAARSALPGAPVVAPASVPTPVAAPRRAVASGLRSLADRLAPEHAERTHWQGA
ncbi:MAG TPA: hypothetical protein VD836_10780 [Solirubrobacteraceae bacterium]|nr:hypothetical protein [Solirubrobacteraceae bacterium]